MKIKSIILPLFAIFALAVSSVAFAGNALQRASLTGNIAEVKNQLDAGENPNSVDDNGMTALMAAARNGHVEIVKVLLWGTNPIVEWLLEKDINPTNLWFSVISNPNLTNNNGDTALDFAKDFGFPEIVRILKEAGAKKSLIKRELEFIKFAEQGNLAEVKRILADGINPNAVNKYNWTALHRAAQAGYAEIVKALLSAGADVNATNKFGDDTALSLAKQQGHTEIVRILEEAGAKE